MNMRWPMPALMLGMLLSSCGGTGPGSERSPGALPLSSCVVAGASAARCGSLSVLEDPAKPQGRRISLGVVVLPAHGKQRAADPLFYFAGGPGAAASDDIAWAAATFGQLNGRHDLVFVDQRGTGNSNAMKCPDLMSVGADPASGRMPSGDVLAQAARACLATVSGVNAGMYTTPNSVDDVDRVRAALGYDSIDIYGASYGVSSGLAYIQHYGDHVRSAVFDSGSLLDVRIWERSAQGLDDSLKSVVNRCSGDVSCHAAFPALSRELTDVITRLGQAPVHLQLQDKNTGKELPITIDKTVFGQALSQQLATVTLMAGVPLFIHRAYLSEWAPLAEQVEAARPVDNPQTTMVMARTIECSDEWARMDPGRISEVARDNVFGSYEAAVAVVQKGFCAAWPAAAGSSGIVRTDAPVVFLNGTADPADPPANVADAPKTMPNSLVVSVPGYGHGQVSQDSSGCFVKTATAFVDAGARSTEAMWACASSPPFPPFILS